MKFKLTTCAGTVSVTYNWPGYGFPVHVLLDLEFDVGPSDPADGEKFKAAGPMAKFHCAVNCKLRRKLLNEGFYPRAVAAVEGIEPGAKRLAGGAARNRYLGTNASD